MEKLKLNTEKLQLRKEIVANLTDPQMKMIIGGTGTCVGGCNNYTIPCTTPTITIDTCTCTTDTSTCVSQCGPTCDLTYYC